MADFTYGLAKGLREPCSPYREAYYFGAELNKPSADGWNCLAELVHPTTTFDLSAISPGREVVVALLRISEAPAGDYTVRFRWYRERDNAFLYEYIGTATRTRTGWIYAYSYIGYVAWEIAENGNYRVEITASGAVSYSKTLFFAVSGIPVIEPVPVPSTGFMAPIISGLNSIAGFFYLIYFEVNGWVWPFWTIGGHFYQASKVFNNLAWSFNNFSEWVNTITDQIPSILNWATIWSYIISSVPNLVEIRDWFYNWGYWVGQRIDQWWSDKVLTVLAWIEDAKLYAASLVDNVSTSLASLQAAWDDFKGMIPTLDSIIYWFSNWWRNVLVELNLWWTDRLVDIQGLIDSAFIVRENYWRGWQEWRDQVAEFFTDPEDWLYKAVDRIIERFW